MRDEDRALDALDRLVTASEAGSRDALEAALEAVACIEETRDNWPELSALRVRLQRAEGLLDVSAEFTEVTNPGISSAEMERVADG